MQVRKGLLENCGKLLRIGTGANQEKLVSTSPKKVVLTAPINSDSEVGRECSN